MKKVKKVLLVGLLSTIFILNGYAASGSLSTNASSIENGGSVRATVTLRDVAAWNVRISSSGNTNGCTEQFVGDTGTGRNVSTKTFSVTCRANSTGTIHFNLSGDITSQDGTNVNVSGSRSVSVVVPRQKSSNNNLKSLSVSNHQISPEFNKDVKDYTLLVSSDVTSITINGTKESSYASISGTGEKEVSEGVNSFEIIVTSETGVSNIYNLKVTVEDLNPINVTIDGKEYTVVKKIDELKKPDLFDESSILINDISIPSFENDLIGYTLVGLKDLDGEINLFVYSDGVYTPYIEFSSSSISLVFKNIDNVPKNFVKTVTTINELEVEVYKHNNITLIYGINIATGKESFYKYEASENTVQIFDIEDYLSKVEELDISKLIIYGLSALLGLITLICILLSSKLRKFKKTLAKISENKLPNKVEEKKVESKKEEPKEENNKTKKEKPKNAKK